MNLRTSFFYIFAALVSVHFLSACSDDDSSASQVTDPTSQSSESSTLDTDNDGIPDVLDEDDDGDGLLDVDDSDPRNPDLDDDGLPNSIDDDDDGDGFIDEADAFPTNANEWEDTDGDGIGNNTDADDDGDGISDSIDPDPLVAATGGEEFSEDSEADSETGGAAGNNALGASDPTGKLTADGFFLLYDPADPEVFNDERAYTQQEVTITINANDVNDLEEVSGQTVNFRTEWGSWKGVDSCQLEDGRCSVVWVSGDPATAPQDCFVAMTAYAVGEETYFDANDNSLLESTEVFFDLEEPFLDVNGNRVFDSTAVTLELVGELIDIENFDGTTPDSSNGMHDSGDGLYTGSQCAPTNNNCTSRTSMVIHTRSQLRIQDPFDEPDGEDTNGNSVTDEEDILFCNVTPYPTP
jgi:hypothetical protein